MSEYHFSNALGYSFEQLATMHNSSFSGYFMPVTMTAAQVSDFWRMNQIDATRCVVMHDEHDTFVGMARMGTRGTRGWCGGFGITPKFRGTGASRLLATQMVNVARSSGLTQLQLEVLSQNIAAIKTYERIGFKIQRRLFGLEIATQALPSNGSLPMQSITPAALLRSIEESLVRPYWGFEQPAMLTQHIEMLAVTGPDKQVNTFISDRRENKIRIQAAHLQPELTDAVFATLLRSVAADATTINIFNEPEDSPLLQRYIDIGFTEFFSQYEMFLPL